MPLDSTMEREQFKQGLIEDLAKAQDQSKKGAEARGFTEDAEFAPRALRIKNKAVAQEQLQAYDNKVKEVIDDLVSESGIVDDGEEGLFRVNLQRKFNQLKMYSIKETMRVQRQLGLEKMDEQKRQATWAAIGSVFGAATEGVVSNTGRRSASPAKRSAAPEDDVLQGGI
jgi:hypothetical protein